MTKTNDKLTGTTAFRLAFESQSTWTRKALVKHLTDKAGLQPHTAENYVKRALRPGAVHGVLIEADGEKVKLKQMQEPKSKSVPQSTPDPKAAEKAADKKPQPKSKSSKRKGKQSTKSKSTKAAK